MKTIRYGFKYLLLAVVLSGAAQAQTNITVNASSTLVAIPSEIYGTNMVAWVGSNNGSDQTYVTAMQVSGSRDERWPGGSWGDIVNWNDIQCVGNWTTNTPEYISFLQQFGGQMHAIVNFSGYWCVTQYTHAQAVSLAAAWVAWNLTNTGSAKATYWDVGNEGYGSWEQGGQGSAGSTLTGAVYGNYFVDYYNAMKAVDPTILIGAVASPGASDYDNWTPDVLTACKNGGVVPDYLVIHNYPGSSGTGAAIDAASLGNYGIIVGQTASLNSMVSQYLGSSYVGKVKYFGDEYNINNVASSLLCNEYINAMFCSQYILEAAKNGWAGADLWAAKNGAAAGDGDPGFLNVTTDVPYPNYYVWPVLTGKFGTNMVSCGSNASLVNAYAATDASGNLTLFMVNNDPNNNYPASVSVSGFAPASTGRAWVMLPQGTSPTAGAPQEAPGIQINGNANPAPASLASIAGVVQPTGSTFTVNLQPSEMAMIVIPPSTSQPTATETATGTATATMTNSATSSATSTATATPTSSHTLTATPSASPTASSTASNTATKTTTPTTTNTLTLTATNTPTNILVNTATPTLSLTNTSIFTITNTLTSTFTPSYTPTWSSTPTVTLTPTLTLSRTNTSTWTPTFTFSYTPTWTASYTPTITYTRTFTPTPTATLTYTPTWTATLTPTFSPTTTSTSTVTMSPTPTTTIAPTPLPGHVGIYPNPVTGPTVQVLPPAYSGIERVRVEVFTMAFRKVQETTYPSLPSGQAITLSLTGRDGVPLANGLYYVVVTVNGQRSTGKLLVLR